MKIHGSELFVEELSAARDLSQMIARMKQFEPEIWKKTMHRFKVLRDPRAKIHDEDIIRAYKQHTKDCMDQKPYDSDEEPEPSAMEPKLSMNQLKRVTLLRNSSDPSASLKIDDLASTGPLVNSDSEDNASIENDTCSQLSDSFAPMEQPSRHGFEDEDDDDSPLSSQNRNARTRINNDTPTTAAETAETANDEPMGTTGGGMTEGDGRDRARSVRWRTSPMASFESSSPNNPAGRLPEDEDKIEDKDKGESGKEGLNDDTIILSDTILGSLDSIDAVDHLVTDSDLKIQGALMEGGIPLSELERTYQDYFQGDREILALVDRVSQGKNWPLAIPRLHMPADLDHELFILDNAALPTFARAALHKIRKLDLESENDRLAALHSEPLSLGESEALASHIWVQLHTLLKV
jgi:hypothetical protein